MLSHAHSTSERDQLLVHRHVGPRVVEGRQPRLPQVPDLPYGCEFVRGESGGSRLAVVESQQPQVPVKDLSVSHRLAAASPRDL